MLVLLTPSSPPKKLLMVRVIVTRIRVGLLSCCAVTVVEATPLL